MLSLCEPIQSAEVRVPCSSGFHASLSFIVANMTTLTRVAPASRASECARNEGKVREKMVCVCRTA